MSEISANEIFAGLYDQIFLQDMKNIYTDDKISSITKKFLESNATIEEKKYFLKLKNQYFRIKSINDYKLLQKKLYNNKSRREIILFEVTRILNSDKLNIKIANQVEDIKKILSMQDSVLTDELYNKIVKLIIRIEMALNMKIGLFDELCSLFESELDNVSTNVLVNDNVLNRKK